MRRLSYQRLKRGQGEEWERGVESLGSEVLHTRLLGLRGARRGSQREWDRTDPT